MAKSYHTFLTNLLKNMTKIKICGLRDIAHAQIATQAGADDIGLVFYTKSPRHVDIGIARNICLALPPFVNRVGLFVNAEPDQLETILEKVPLSLLQFHGDEDNAMCQQFGMPFIKALRVQEGMNIEAEMARFPDACGFLLDAYHPEHYGGSGVCFDWQQFPHSAEQPIILAGGLTPDNVGEAVSTLKPYAVDVSSGVEREKGVKDATKIRSFCAAAKES